MGRNCDLYGWRSRDRHADAEFMLDRPGTISVAVAKTHDVCVVMSA